MNEDSSGDVVALQNQIRLLKVVYLFLSFYILNSQKLNKSRRMIKI